MQGAIFWIETGPQDDGGRRPYVVLQNNIANRSRIDTVIVCGLTTQLRLAGVGGNVLLDPGEGNLPRQSIVKSPSFLRWPSGSWTSTSEFWSPPAFARSSTVCGACWSRGPCRKQEAISRKREIH